MKQKVLISIDTECPAGKNPIEALIYGKTSDGGEYGINYLMELFDQYKTKGLFFVDIAEAWDYGANKIADVLHRIEACGHNTGVHLHPDHMADENRRYLWQYRYDEQYEMIARCTDFYEKELHKPPISFRAGRYGVNNDTVKILSQFGYKYDMSQFYGSRYCKIEPYLSCNKMIRINNLSLIEVPVTSYKSFTSPLYSRFDKVDCTLDIQEFSRVMSKICMTDYVDVVSFFVHSFSVLDWRKNPDKPKVSKKLNKRLIEQLKWVAECKEAEFITEADLSAIKINSNGANEKIVDVSKGIVPYWFFLKRALEVMKAKSIRNV